METFTLDKDINLIYVQASSFPEGILNAFDTLYSKVSDIHKRRQFGISRPENGKIAYKAAVEELLSGEASILGLQFMSIPKGRYVSAIVKDFMNNVSDIGNTFNQLLGVNGIDSQGYCVECYLNPTDVKCMVRLAD